MGFFDFSRIQVNRPRKNKSARANFGMYVAAIMLVSASSVGAQNLAHDELSSGLTGYRQSVAEHIGSDEGLASFYRDRKFAPIWTGEDSSNRDRLSALLSALADADKHGLPQDGYDRAGWIARLSDVRDDRALGQIEVELSKLYLSFAHDLQSGLIDNPGRIDGDIKRRPPRRNAEALLTRIATEPPRQVFQTLAPQSPEYLRLMREKIRLERVVAVADGARRSMATVWNLGIAAIMSLLCATVLSRWDSCPPRLRGSLMANCNQRSVHSNRPMVFQRMVLPDRPRWPP